MDTDFTEDSLSSSLTETASVLEEDFQFETVKVEPDIQWITDQTPTAAPADNVADCYEFDPKSQVFEFNDDEDELTSPKRRTRRGTRSATKKSKKLVCDECGLRPNSAEAMEDHRALHRAICPFRCSHCVSSFPSRALLARHRLDMHLQAKERFPCHDCKAVLWSEAAVLSHRKKLHPAAQGRNPPVMLAPPYRCHYCGDRFPTDALLGGHMPTHGQLPFSCPVCGLAVASSGELNRHAALHPEVPKPFRCSDCNQPFSSFTGMSNHARKHSGPRPCQECGALYFNPTELERHLEEHGGLVHLDRFLQLLTLASDAEVLFSESDKVT